MNDPLIPVEVAKTTGAVSGLNPFDHTNTPTVEGDHLPWFEEPGAPDAVEDAAMGVPADSEYGYPHANAHR